MTPMQPDERARLLSVPGVTEADIDEYESLLAQRFAIDPSQVPTTEGQSRDRKLEDLRNKLYPQPTP
jgi:hypothetical protein